MPRAVTNAQLLGALARCVQLVTRPRAKWSSPPRPASQGYARPVLALWTRLDYPPLGALEGDPLELEASDLLPGSLARRVALLAHACRVCPDPVFSSHFRGLNDDGSRWKRSPPRYVPATVLRLDPPTGSAGATVEERLEVASAWADRGYPEQRNGAWRTDPSVPGGSPIVTRTDEQIERAYAAYCRLCEAGGREVDQTLEQLRAQVRADEAAQAARSR